MPIGGVSSDHGQRDARCSDNIGQPPERATPQAIETRVQHRLRRRRRAKNAAVHLHLYPPMPHHTF
jgi:hypothetical protein